MCFTAPRQNSTTEALKYLELFIFQGTSGHRISLVVSDIQRGRQLINHHLPSLQLLENTSTHPPFLLTHPPFLLTHPPYLLICLPTFLPPSSPHTSILNYLPSLLPGNLLTYLSTNLAAFLPTYLPNHLPTILPTCLLTYLASFKLSCLPTYLPTSLPT